jgi:hypothetical protein
VYAKLFASIYQGTLRGNTHGIVVFTNLMAHADCQGWVDIHPRAIADEVGLTLEQVQAALVELEAPDPESRSPEENGRRIVRLDEHRAWGWRIVNHAKYRAIRNEDDRREQNRLAQARWRERNQSKPHKPKKAHTEAEAEAEAKEENHTEHSGHGNGASKPAPGAFEVFWRHVDPELLAVMLAAIDRQRGTEQWRKDDGQFIPHPATWLNGGRWHDEVESQPRGPGPSGMTRVAL